MTPREPMILDRRRFLRRFAGAGATLLVAGCGSASTSSAPGARDAASAEPDKPAGAPPPPPTGDPALEPPRVCVATADNIEGPYYKADAPDRMVFVDDQTPGTRLALSGRVTGTDCGGLARCELDVWHADAEGGYDNRGYTFRGVLATARDGQFRIDTIVPGRYLNGKRYRPAHIHFKLRAAGYEELTTQLYFEGDPYNDGDPFIHRSLIMPLRRDGDTVAAAFDFVLTRP